MLEEDSDMGLSGVHCVDASRWGKKLFISVDSALARFWMTPTECK